MALKLQGIRNKMSNLLTVLARDKPCLTVSKTNVEGNTSTRAFPVVTLSVEMKVCNIYKKVAVQVLTAKTSTNKRYYSIYYKIIVNNLKMVAAQM